MRFIFVCALLGVFVSHFIGAVVFRFTNFVCMSYNESWFKVHQCRLKAISRENVILNMNGTILHAVNTIHLQYIMLKKANGFKPWLVDSRMDVCRFLRSNYDPTFKIIFNLFKDFTNANHTCPYSGPVIVKGFYLRPELLILPFPTGEYMLSLRWSYDHRHQIDTNISFLFVEDMKKT
ncbi:uncharacterized protein [Drosophila kikkawai]|uniref:MD-2-related lipid-recognition domain-containing protein n=1 Tax=Drosophila kikkawai TaxID=30033 RepID=A0A6P4I1F3_DROKI|nr:uncharacterized protein LOC108070505 [Drosophila kikkawai]